VKALHRHALRVAGLVVATLASGTSIVHAQARGTPTAETPRVLVGTFRSNDRTLGVQVSDALRSRVTSEFAARDLWAISKNDINATLEGSGYRPDSALSANDMKELAKILRTDEILDGTVTRTDAGVRVEARLLLARDIGLSQPLPVAEAGKASDAAKQLVRDYEQARKQLADNRRCENHLRASEFDKAIAAANAGIAKYPNATLARLCLATAYQLMKAPTDSILRVTEEIIKLDPRSRIALGLRYEAYKNANNTDRAMETLIAMLEADPTNQNLQTSVVEELARSGQAARAVPIITKLVEDNPGDVSLLRTKWVVLLRANDFKNAVAAGEELVRVDTAMADSSYFLRQVAALTSDSQPQRAAEMAARGAQRFPNSPTMFVAQASALRQAGQLGPAAAAAQRALAIDPRSSDAHVLLIRSHIDAGQSDSALAAVTRASQAGVEKKTLAAFVLQQGNALYKAAEASQKPEDHRRAIAVLEVAEQLDPGPTSKFLIGASNFRIALAALQEGQAKKSCASLKVADQAFTQAQINVTAGGSTSPEGAKQILGLVQQYSAYVPQLSKQYNCR